jgi:hypothetical protein
LQMPGCPGVNRLVRPSGSLEQGCSHLVSNSLLQPGLTVK